MEENLFEKAAALSKPFLDTVFALQDLDVVTDVRGYGLIAGFDVKPSTIAGGRGVDLQKKLYNAGIHIKFTGDSGIIAPPFVDSEQDIEEICGIVRDVLSKEK